MMAHAIRRHVCSICSKSYAKAEHLHRHQRSHTGAKPFACGECGQKFTRLDSLSRHQQRQGHNKSISTSSRPNYELERESSPSEAPPFDETTPRVAVTASDSTLQDLETANLTEPISLPNVNGFNPDESLLENSVGTDFISLTWPDSEAFLQSILNIDVSSWPQNYDNLPSNYLFQAPLQPVAQAQSPWLADSATEGSRNGSNAIRNISQIISNLSSDLASEAESAALSTTYLEACLHTFFEQMSLVLPVCHRPTFIFGDWTHPLLLNAIALGSLFMGQDINVAKGEVLWTLAHTAVATSWHSLIEHRGPYDNSSGVQLVMTALLGQTFAMLSGTSKLRSTAQIFHSLGFYWARQCGMYNSTMSLSPLQTTQVSSEEEQILEWRRWAAEEVKLRALLGHYVLDGQLTYFTGAPTCQRHTSNLLHFPCSDQLFASSTLQEWQNLRYTDQFARMTFHDFFIQVFQDPSMIWFQHHHVSLLAMQVVLEGFQSLITDLNIVGDQVIGSPSADTIERVLYSFQDFASETNLISTGEKFQVLLRWHTICIDKDVNFSRLCRDVCSQLNVQQKIFTTQNESSSAINFSDLVQSQRARKALLHAVAIRNILSQLPMQVIHALHIPVTIFAAAIVHIAFVLGGVKNILLPTVSRWSSLIDSDDDVESERTDVHRYLSGLAFERNTNYKNLLYDMNKFLLLTKQLRRPWAIYGDIGTILHQMYAKCAG